MKTIKACGHEVDAAELLAALYNNAKPLGWGLLQYDPTPMSAEEASQIIDANGFNVDYLKGRPLKLYVHEGKVDGGLYDRDHGVGAFEGVVLGLTTGETA